MSRFIALCLVAVSTVARAGHFPVTAAYGTPSACAAFAEGGIQAVETGDDVSAILVTRTDLAAVGLTCPADKADVKGTKVTAACTLAQDQPFKLVATIEENAPAKTVKYIARRPKPSPASSASMRSRRKSCQTGRARWWQGCA